MEGGRRRAKGSEPSALLRAWQLGTRRRQDCSDAAGPLARSWVGGAYTRDTSLLIEEGVMGSFEDEVEATRCWMESERFAETTRLYTPRQVVEQRGTVLTDYPVARNAAERFCPRLRELFAQAIVQGSPARTAAHGKVSGEES